MFAHQILNRGNLFDTRVIFLFLDAAAVAQPKSGEFANRAAAPNVAAD